MGYRILLIDDEDDILEFVKYNLSRDGYEVFTASNGAEGLEVALRVKPHLILLDMMMPVLDGIETCKALRRSPALKKCNDCIPLGRRQRGDTTSGLQCWRR